MEDPVQKSYSYFRSQDMTFSHLVCNEDCAWDILNEIGDLSAMHFVDPEPNAQAMNRPFYNYVKRCNELEEKLKTIRENIRKFGFIINKCENHQNLLKYFKKYLKDRATNEGKKDGKTYLNEIEQEVLQQTEQLQEQLKNYEDLIEQQNQMKEYKAVIFNAQQHMGDTLFNNNGFDEQNMNQQDDFMGANSLVGMNQIVGLIESIQQEKFERQVFRVTKGNVFVKIIDIDWQNDPIKDPHSFQPVDKKIFVIIFPGGTMDIIKNKINRVCDAFNCSKYGLPSNQQQTVEKLAELEEKKKDLENLCNLTRRNLENIAEQWAKQRVGADCSKIEEYELYCVKEKGLYSCLNMLQTNNKIYQGYAWVPSNELESVQEKLGELSSQSNVQGQLKRAEPPKKETPPTFFQTNEFTGVFQLITDTYGAPRYKEINPSLFNAMTFPFLFGVMFGDIGHGGLLFLFGLFLVIMNQRLKGTALGFFLEIRFFILFMGFFAFYNGLIYNDFMALSLNLFGSSYNPDPEGAKNGVYSFNTECNASDPKRGGDYTKCVYPFGVDPIWAIADNNISFMNSFKMKTSVILGVIQMLFGIFLKGMNAIYFKQPLDFFFEFIPQFVFLCCTFGYMDFMIFYKWCINFQNENSEYAPSIITLLINWVLQMGQPMTKKESEDENGSYLYGGVDGKEQGQIQLVLLLVAVVMIPLMLCVKPLVLMCQQKDHSKPPKAYRDHEQPLLAQEQDNSQLGQSLEENQIASQDTHENEEDHEEEHGIGEIFVHQIIETIEFVLGSISNTASYLRLWALSLAHSQLAEVFFENGIAGMIGQGGATSGIMLIFGYFIFAFITFGVLMCMDVMECFLHALRLHWVEFQNKFYKADGILFKPFSFQQIMKENAEEQEQSGGSSE